MNEKIGRPTRCLGEKLLLALVCVILSTGTVSGLPHLEEVGRWAHGPVSAVQVDEGRLFMGSGRFFVVLSAFESGDPEPVGQVALPGPVRDIAIVDTFAYVAMEESGLAVVDVSDPEDPQLLNAIDTPGFAAAVAVNGEHVYVADGFAGITVIDIAIPGEPVLAFSQAFAGFVTDVKTSASWVYAAIQGKGLIVVRANVPGVLKKVGFFDAKTIGPRIAIGTGIVLVADQIGDSIVVDVSDPVYPSRLDTLYHLERSRSITMQDDMILVTDDDGHLKAMDFSNPDRPVYLGRFLTAGSAEMVVMAGNRAIVADGSAGLVIVNLSDVSAPWMGSSALSDYYATRAVALQGPHAYVAAGSGLHNGSLQVFDISVAGPPEAVGVLEGFDLPIDIAVGDRVAFVLMLTSHVAVVDISNPTQPVMGGLIEINLSWDSDIEVVGTTAYIAGPGGLTIIDASNANDPQILGSHKQKGYEIAIEGAYAYLASYGDLIVMDVADPSQPEVIAIHESWWRPYEFAVADGYIYFADASTDAKRLRVVDIHDPLQPKVVSAIDIFSPRGLVLVDGIAYVDGPGHLYLVDFQNVEHPILRSQSISGRFGDLAVEGDRLAVLDRWSGRFSLTLFDVSDPSRPLSAGAIGSLGGGWSGLGVALEQKQAFVAAGHDGLQIFDIAEPEQPSLISDLDTPGYATEIVYSDGYAFIADGPGGLQVVDVSDSVHPIIIGSLQTPGSANAVAVHGDLAIVIDTVAGIIVADVGDPASPAKLSQIPTLTPQTSVVLKDDRAYLTDGELAFALTVIDISDPSAPFEEGAFVRPGSAEDAYVNDEIAVVVGRRKLRVFDVLNSRYSNELGMLELPEDAVAVTVSENMAYVIGKSSLSAVSLDDPTAPVLMTTTAISGELRAVSAESDSVVIVTARSGLAVFDTAEFATTRSAAISVRLR